MWIADYMPVSQWNALWSDQRCAPCNLECHFNRRTLVELSRPATQNYKAVSRKPRNLAPQPKMSSVLLKNVSSNVRLPSDCCGGESMNIVPRHIYRNSCSLCIRGRGNLRSRFQQIGDRGKYMRKGRQSIFCSLASNVGTDAAVVSEEKEAQKLTDTTLEYVHKVALDVVAPPDIVWKLWIDIKSAPQWMRWIDRVEFLTEDESTAQELPPGLSQLSRWICSTAGFEVMWVARVEYVESTLPVRVLRWATVEGLQSQGEVTFKENNSHGTTVEMSISHSLPAALGRVMNSSALRGLVQATLQSDLECFQKYAAKAVGQENKFVSNEEGTADGRGTLTITTNCSLAPENTL